MTPALVFMAGVDTGLILSSVARRLSQRPRTRSTTRRPGNVTNPRSPRD